MPKSPKTSDSPRAATRSHRHLCAAISLIGFLTSNLAFAGGHTVPGPDTDSDGFNDYIESRMGTDPNDASSVPGIVDAFIDFESGEIDNAFVPNDADAGWFISDQKGSTSFYSVLTYESEDLNTGEIASFVWPVVVNDTTLSFWHWRNAAPEDLIKVYVDDVEVFNNIGIGGNWVQSPDISIAAGYHEIRFDFVKVSSGSTYCDCGRIDNILLMDDISDNDGLPDLWELQNGLDPNDPADELFDLDGDGLNNLDEYNLNTDVQDPDTDQDGLTDGDEVHVYFSNPRDRDTDDDTLLDGDEVAAGTDPAVDSRTEDNDGDGIDDYAEVRLGFDPNDSASTPTPIESYFAGFEAGMPPNWFQSFPWSGTWFRTDASAWQGSWSLESEEIYTNSHPRITFPVLVGETNLDFRYLRDSDISNGNGRLKVYLDDVLVFEDEGGFSWLAAPTIPLSAGYHEIRFHYDAWSSNGTFCACVRIDNVLISDADVDADQIRDEWELANGLNPNDPSDATQDADSDGLLNIEEYNLQLDPNDPDMDADGLLDGEEVNVLGTDPQDADTDDDEIPDGWEVDNGLDPLTSSAYTDTDGDGTADLYEFLRGLDPQDPSDAFSYNDNYTENFEDPSATDFWIRPTGERTFAREFGNAWEGDWSLRSDNRTDSSQVVASITLPIRVHESVMNFRYWRNGSGNLNVYVDGVQVFSTASSGNYWQLTPDIPLSDAYHEIRFDFVYPQFGSSGCVCVRIDDLVINFPDADGDLMADDWELANGLNPNDPSDATQDADSDGLINVDEYNLRIDPNNPDVDADGLLDGEEVNVLGTDPEDADTDDDQIPDGWELDNGLDPLTSNTNVDTDGDGTADPLEYLRGLDPQDPSDGFPYNDNYAENFEDPSATDFWIRPPAGERTFSREMGNAWEGDWALKSDNRTDSSQVVATITLPIRVHESVMNFRYWRNGNGNLNVYLDGNQVFSTAGQGSFWQQTPDILLSDAYHEIRFDFIYPLGSSGCVCVRIDDLQITTIGTPIDVAIDIQPGQAGNVIHTNHNGDNTINDVIEVGVLGAMMAVGDPVDFNTDDIDAATLGFGPSGGAIDPASTPAYNLDLDSDGIDDAQFEFLTGDSGITCGETSATLTGWTTTGEFFEGTDVIQTECNAACHN